MSNSFAGFDIVSLDGGHKAVKVHVVGLEGDVEITGDAVVDTSALEALIGSTDDAPWDGQEANATVISLLKAIAINTAPPGGDIN